MTTEAKPPTVEDVVKKVLKRASDTLTAITAEHTTQLISQGGVNFGTKVAARRFALAQIEVLNLIDRIAEEYAEVNLLKPLDYGDAKPYSTKHLRDVYVAFVEQCQDNVKATDVEFDTEVQA